MKEYKYRINGNEYKVTINSIEEEKAQLEVNGTSYTVDIVTDKKPAKPAVKRPAPATTPISTSAPVAASAPGCKGTGVKAPLPGVIIDICVKVGDEVTRGQKIAVLEAMKMENSINADHDGKVLAVKVNKGDSILEGSDILIVG